MQRFEMTHKHVTLLRNAYVSWNGAEHGAPTIDPKRPYGNADVPRDMLRILDIEWQRDEEDDYLPMALRARMDELHENLGHALQIILATGAFEVGVYEADDCRRNWRAV